MFDSDPPMSCAPVVQSSPTLVLPDGCYSKHTYHLWRVGNSRPSSEIPAAMAGLSGYLYPVNETLSDPLIAKADRGSTASTTGEGGIEVEDTASGYRHGSAADTERDALTNSTTFGGKDGSTSSSSQSGSMSSNSATTLSGKNSYY